MTHSDHQNSDGTEVRMGYNPQWREGTFYLVTLADASHESNTATRPCMTGNGRTNHTPPLNIFGSFIQRQDAKR